MSYVFIGFPVSRVLINILKCFELLNKMFAAVFTFKKYQKLLSRSGRKQYNIICRGYL